MKMAGKTPKEQKLKLRTLDFIVQKASLPDISPKKKNKRQTAIQDYVKRHARMEARLTGNGSHQQFIMNNDVHTVGVFDDVSTVYSEIYWPVHSFGKKDLKQRISDMVIQEVEAKINGNEVLSGPYIASMSRKGFDETQLRAMFPEIYAKFDELYVSGTVNYLKDPFNVNMDAKVFASYILRAPELSRQIIENLVMDTNDNHVVLAYVEKAKVSEERLEDVELSTLFKQEIEYVNRKDLSKNTYFNDRISEQVFEFLKWKYEGFKVDDEKKMVEAVKMFADDIVLGLKKAKYFDSLPSPIFGAVMINTDQTSEGIVPFDSPELCSKVEYVRELGNGEIIINVPELWHDVFSSYAEKFPEKVKVAMKPKEEYAALPSQTEADMQRVAERNTQINKENAEELQRNKEFGSKARRKAEEIALDREIARGNQTIDLVREKYGLWSRLVERDGNLREMFKYVVSDPVYGLQLKSDLFHKDRKQLETMGNKDYIAYATRTLNSLYQQMRLYQNAVDAFGGNQTQIPINVLKDVPELGKLAKNLVARLNNGDLNDAVSIVGSIAFVYNAFLGRKTHDEIIKGLEETALKYTQAYTGSNNIPKDNHNIFPQAISISAKNIKMMTSSQPNYQQARLSH